ATTRAMSSPACRTVKQKARRFSTPAPNSTATMLSLPGAACSALPLWATPSPKPSNGPMSWQRKSAGTACSTATTLPTGPLPGSRAEARARRVTASARSLTGLFYGLVLAFNNSHNEKEFTVRRTPLKLFLLLTVTLLVSACSRQSIYENAIGWERSSAGLEPAQVTVGDLDIAYLRSEEPVD